MCHRLTIDRGSLRRWNSVHGHEPLLLSMYSWDKRTGIPDDDDTTHHYYGCYYNFGNWVDHCCSATRFDWLRQGFRAEVHAQRGDLPPCWVRAHNESTQKGN